MLDVRPAPQRIQPELGVHQAAGPGPEARACFHGPTSGVSLMQLGGRALVHAAPGEMLLSMSHLLTFWVDDFHPIHHQLTLRKCF